MLQRKQKKTKKSGVLSHYTLTPPICQGEGIRIAPQEGRGLGDDLFEGSFEKDPSSSPKTPQQKGLLPSERSANNALPFFVRYRGVFVRRCCSTDFSLCPSRSWTSSKPRPTGCWRIVGVNISLPPRGRLTLLPLNSLSPPRATTFHPAEQDIIAERFHPP